MIRAIVVDGTYNSLRLGEIYNVAFMDRLSVFVEGISRAYNHNVFAYVDKDGSRLTQAEATKRFKQYERIRQWESSARNGNTRGSSGRI